MRPILICALSSTLLALPAIAAAAAGEAFASTYQPLASSATVLRHATVLIGNGQRLDNADVLLRDGKIAALGTQLQVPDGSLEIDARDKWVTPGLIDVHSHLGVYASPGVTASADGNEMSAPVTAQVWAEHGVWPQDPGFAKALAGGITSMQVLPGSANLIGGRGVTLKNVPATTMQAMKFAGAPHGLKMACGENPKRVYGTRMQSPMTRMGNMAGYRAAFSEAREYAEQWADYAKATAKAGKDKKTEPAKAPKRDLRLDTLAAVLNGEIQVHIHCYRADEMANMIALADEFGFKIAAFHHGVEAYKIADVLAKEHICGALWADWWGFKMEAYDGIEENIALVDRPEGGCAIVHSDSAEGIQRLNQEAAKVIGSAQRVGIAIAPERAIRWLTENAARALGVLEHTGTLEAGKMADVVVWNGNPFSVYAKADQVFIDGALLYDRNDPAHQPTSDFMLGQEASP
ncbi:MAG: amidohydrolase [Lysobacterales bacterium CG17_big_fil_post_rev_8_21_14_2_50_64_11]|nr:MAG: amidohydrolase [Xanthomonadales bacterium CG17_big_fil_post_rev_8_21_14_2_50_64_11]PIX61373.1 MAG: amidohydrolase [Xanthomonadales bacterium CG_4_10_14_3_um_filter_64_11]